MFFSLFLIGCSLALADPSVEEAFRKTKTDKLSRHGYHRFYQEAFRPYYNQSISLLEIGVLDGKSLESWGMIFPKANRIVGITYKRTKTNLAPGSKEKVVVYEGDQGDASFLDQVIAAVGAFDIIIDDGSHWPRHQLGTFRHLYPTLNWNGLYVIEDLETNYWDRPGAKIYGYPLDGAGIGKRPTGSVLDIFKDFVDVVNRAYYNRIDNTIMNHDDKTIETITFGSNLVMFRKQPRPTNPYLVPKNRKQTDGRAYRLWKQTHPDNYIDSLVN